MLVARLALALLALTACSQAAPLPTPSPTPTPPGPLLTVHTRGGLCPAATCERTIVIERDGTVREAAKQPNEVGVVPVATLAALDQAIAAADFDAIRSRPFTGTCPIAYDGQEIVFDFVTATAIERVASCQVEIDYSDPLFAAAVAAVTPFLALPN